MSRMDLPERIVELLSKPNLTALPENPVGAVWEAFRRQYDGFEEVALEEKIDPDKVREILANVGNGSLEEYLTAASRQQWLRRELTVPMVMEAAGREAPVRLIATGKTYRIDNEEESSTRLHAFHPAEVLWVGEGLSEWQLMGPFSEFIRELNPEIQLRIQQFDYSLHSDRGWKIAVQLRDGVLLTKGQTHRHRPGMEDCGSTAGDGMELDRRFGPTESRSPRGAWVRLGPVDRGRSRSGSGAPGHDAVRHR